jgi:hypothetical protein
MAAAQGGCRPGRPNRSDQASGTSPERFGRFFIQKGPAAGKNPGFWMKSHTKAQFRRPEDGGFVRFFIQIAEKRPDFASFCMKNHTNGMKRTE